MSKGRCCGDWSCHLWCDAGRRWRREPDSEVDCSPGTDDGELNTDAGRSAEGGEGSIQLTKVVTGGAAGNWLYSGDLSDITRRRRRIRERSVAEGVAHLGGVVQRKARLEVVASPLLHFEYLCVGWFPVRPWAPVSRVGSANNRHRGRP